MERISVAIRVRPPGKEDLIRGNRWVIEESQNKVTLCNCYGAPMPGYSYAFDQLFGPDSRNFDVYNIHAKDVVMSSMRGFNGTVFAYGQTSSGKTYTMQGSDDHPGIIRLAIRDIFDEISKTSGREFLARVSYMEIYNEEINDLLAPENRKLQIHENFERGVFVAGLREEIVNGPDQVFDFLKLGEAHRHIGETNMNLYSSRSHTIFRMVIESRDKSRNTDAVRVSTLNMVDLAGSERVGKTGAGGVRLREGGHINKSLMTLGTVINKLSEGPGKGGHIPYRDSKLTRILQSALDGNAKTAIICTITPDEIHIDETRGTLQFASRAKKVATCAHVNEILTDAALLKRQKREIEELRQKLQGLQSDDFEKQLLNLRNDLLKYELEKEKLALELEEERKTQAERERRIREQEQKIENLSSLVRTSSSSREDHLKTSKLIRRETWSPQQDSYRSPLSRLDNSLISTRRDRDRTLTPLPAFEALLEKEADITTFSSKPQKCSLPLTSNGDNFADENTWASLNNELSNVADEDEWTRLNQGADIISNTVEAYTPCVKTNQIDLMDFQLKELQVQLEELHARYDSKDEEAQEAKSQLNSLLVKYEEINRQMEEMRTIKDHLKTQLNAEKAQLLFQEQRSNDMQRELNQALSANDELNKELTHLHNENALANERIEELKENTLHLGQEVSGAKVQLNKVIQEKCELEEQLNFLIAEKALLQEEKQRLNSLVNDTQLQEREKGEQLNNLMGKYNQTTEQLDGVLNDNKRLQESNTHLEQFVHSQKEEKMTLKREYEQLLAEKTSLQTINEQLKSSIEATYQREKEQVQEYVQRITLLEGSNKLKDTQLHELSAQISAQEEQYKNNQKALNEKLRISEVNISRLQGELHTVNAEKERLSRIIEVQVHKNEEIIMSMRLERVRVAQELARYMSALSCQQDSVSSICSGINTVIRA